MLERLREVKDHYTELEILEIEHDVDHVHMLISNAAQDSSNSSLTLLRCVSAGQELYGSNISTSRGFETLAPAKVPQIGLGKLSTIEKSLVKSGASGGI